MTKKSLVLTVSFFFTSVASGQSLIQYVNPLIGTAKMGHTYPGATVPFGMVQLSPDTDTIPYEVNGKYNPDAYRYCAGYQYDDPTIVGFSHTHFSGTGHSDLGDILLMPYQGAITFHTGVAQNPKSGYRSTFQHANEKAEPNYYQVLLVDENINVELTTTERVGIHRYHFREEGTQRIILDLKHGIYNYDHKNVYTYVRIVNDTLITGYRQTNGWARNRIQYFAIALSQPMLSWEAKNENEAQAYRGFWGKFNQTSNFPDLTGKNLKINLTFPESTKRTILVKVALSPSSMDNAVLNLQTEAPHWDFEVYKKTGQQKWEQELRKVIVTTLNDSDRINFYTALYHTCLGPTIYEDVDGQYRGVDYNQHVSEDFVHYTTFSLWDTYRALHPWFNLMQWKRNEDMVKSMLAHQEQSSLSMLPVWSHHANENWCMIGYHAVSVIADAAIHPYFQFDRQKALNACVKSSNNPYYGEISAYNQYGFVPEDMGGSSVSKTLEYAYDDYCIAQLAQSLGKQQVHKEYLARSERYINVFDANIGFTRPRLKNGNFHPDFDPLNTHQKGYIEGNSWNYSLYVPHRVDRLVELLGGTKNFKIYLDSLFEFSLDETHFAHTEDISKEGIIGNYVHGNEPSHHVVYLYNQIGDFASTQRRVRQILRAMYQAQPDGLGGNDDCGQMSAWYLFSALGFYPVAPASNEYWLGAPLVKQALLSLENGKQLKIITESQSEKNQFVKAVYWNGKKLTDSKLNRNELLEGGELKFIMSANPHKTYFK